MGQIIKQKIFLKEYTEELNRNVKSHNITAYHSDKFDYDATRVFHTQVERQDDLLDIMMPYATPDGDFQAARILFDAFPNITREQAQYPPF